MYTTTNTNMQKTYNPCQFKEIITSMTANKGIGMTEPEWATIVKRNAQK
jgi:N-acetylglutamate synthase/N-acetylornithine aminotransferase